MKRSSVISRAFFRRPAVRDLVPDLKLVLVVATTGCESHTGIYRPAGLSEDTGLDPSALSGALDDLERRGHILVDNKTGEILLLSWYRDNTFATPQRQGQWRDDLAQVDSQTLRAAAQDLAVKNPSCGLSVDNFVRPAPKQRLSDQGQGQGQGKGKGKGKGISKPTVDACRVCQAFGTKKIGGHWYCPAHDHLSPAATSHEGV